MVDLLLSLPTPQEKRVMCMYVCILRFVTLVLLKMKIIFYWISRTYLNLKLHTKQFNLLFDYNTEHCGVKTGLI